MKNNPASAETFRANLRRLMDAHEPPLSQPMLASESGVGQRSIGRILVGEQIPTLDMCDKLAKVFDLRTWQMLQPGLDPRAPPLLTDAREQDLFAKWHLLMQELAKYNRKPNDR